MRIEEERLSEKIVYAAFKEFDKLVAQSKSDPVVYYNLNTQIRQNTKYEYFAYGAIRNASPLQVIKGCIESPNIKTYFFENSKGLYTGFVAIIEEDYKTVEDIKLLSFGRDNSNDENLIFRDLPMLMADICKKYKSITWTAHIKNRANKAYGIAFKKLGGQGDPVVKEDLITYHIKR